MTYESDHGHVHEDQLLEYETEAAEDEVPQIEPIPVIVTEPVVTIPTIAQHVSTFTVVTSTTLDQGVEVLLPLDPLRLKATVLANDQPVVICHSYQQAQSSSNQVANVPNPSGAYLPTGIPMQIQGIQQMWVAATSSTAARVSVIVERRTL